MRQNQPTTEYQLGKGPNGKPEISTKILYSRNNTVTDVKQRKQKTETTAKTIMYPHSQSLPKYKHKKRQSSRHFRQMGQFSLDQFHLAQFHLCEPTLILIRNSSNYFDI